MLGCRDLLSVHLSEDAWSSWLFSDSEPVEIKSRGPCKRLPDKLEPILIGHLYQNLCRVSCVTVKVCTQVEGSSPASDVCFASAEHIRDSKQARGRRERNGGDGLRSAVLGTLVQTREYTIPGRCEHGTQPKQRRLKIFTPHACQKARLCGSSMHVCPSPALCEPYITQPPQLGRWDAHMGVINTHDQRGMHAPGVRNPIQRSHPHPPRPAFLL